ncbi:MAG TPA: alpha/beta hydrolase [Ktedonobacteraceae bacterium]|nr:alpha/beta hydrolase [Ktedonobacteraceae bacterium]
MHNPIVFIHGSGDSARIWRLQVEQLAGDQQAYAIDLPGHGQRLDTLPAHVTVSDYAAAAQEIITDELRLQHPIIAGHSLGGAVALAMALAYGSELGGLILIGTGARLRVHPTLLEAARTTPQEAQHQLGELAVTPAHSGTVPQAITREQAPPAPHILYRDLAACNVFDCMARLDEISLPALIICGVDDRLTPLKYSQFLHERLKGSTLHVIPEAGHYVMREQPEAVNAAIGDWLRQY